MAIKISVFLIFFFITSQAFAINRPISRFCKKQDLLGTWDGIALPHHPASTKKSVHLFQAYRFLADGTFNRAESDKPIPIDDFAARLKPSQTSPASTYIIGTKGDLQLYEANGARWEPLTCLMIEQDRTDPQTQIPLHKGNILLVHKDITLTLRKVHSPLPLKKSAPPSSKEEPRSPPAENKPVSPQML